MKFDACLAQAHSITTLDFPWDEWKIIDAYEVYSTGYEDRLDSLSDAANLALAIALAEWVVSGLREYDHTHEARDAVQACWATFSDTNFPIYTESDDDEWMGPHRQMLAMTFTMLNDAIFCLHESTVVGMRTDWVLMYCQMLFGKQPFFVEWVDRAISALGPIRPDFPPDYDAGVMNPRLVFAPPISRRFFDLDRPYVRDRETAAANAYVQMHLLDNPFVEPG